MGGSVNENEISKHIVECAVPGLLEDVYEEALASELTQRGLRVERQVITPIVYQGKTWARRSD